MSINNNDLLFLKSFRDEDGFAVAAKKYLEIVERDNPAIADDLREIAVLILQKQKTSNIVMPEKDGRKRINFAAYDDAYREWQEGETKLIAASERLYEKYKDDPEQMLVLATTYAKLVSFLPVTKNTARENLFDIYRERRDAGIARGHVTYKDRVPGGILNYLMPNPEPDKNWDENLYPRAFVFDKIDEFIEYVNKTVFKPVLTAHPTNVIRGDYLQLLLEFAGASRELTQGKKKKFTRFEQALAEISKAEMTPTSADGLPRAFSPAEETDMELLALGDMYRNMSGPRRIFDQALLNREILRKDILDEYKPEKRLALRLNVRPMSWVMGDKDGNSNIKSEHLLRSVIVRRLGIVRHYLADIRQLEKDCGIVLPKRKDGASWDDTFIRAEKVLAQVFDEIEGYKKDADIPLSQKKFDSLMQISAKAFGSTDIGGVAQEFIGVLEESFFQGSEKQQDELIKMIDKARSFQLNFATIGLRETAKEYTKIIDFLYKNSEPAYDYSKLSEKEKIKFLDDLVQNPKGLADRISLFLKKIDKTTSLRKYDDNNPRVLVYHTLKCLELAANNPDAFQEKSLAEFEHPSNLLEPLALQKGVSSSIGKPLALSVVPLFEEYKTLEAAPDMLFCALKTKAFRQHLLEMAHGDPSAIKLCVQIAHSDNNRKSGAPAARAGIYEAHFGISQKLRDQYKRIKTLFDKDEESKPVASRISMKNLVITPEFFEGRSQTDTARGGERAQTSLANLYNQHFCSKHTVQGFHDIFAYLQLPESFDRYAFRDLSHNAARMAIMDATRQPDALHRIPEIEAAVIQAFKRTGVDYENSHFKMAGVLFGHPFVNGTLNQMIYNRGSRNASREAEQSVRPTAHGKTMPHESIRAIAFGNYSRDAGIHPAILGARKVEAYLAKAFPKGSVALKKLAEEAREFGYKGHVKDEETGHFTAVGYKTLFNVSPGFRDITHFLSTGCGATALEHSLRRFKRAEKNKNLSFNPRLKKYVTKTVPLELAAAAKLVLGTNGYALPEELQRSMTLTRLKEDQCACLSFLVRTISKTAPECTLNSGLELLPQVLRDNIIEKAANRENGAFTDDDLKVLNYLGAATLSARHARIFTLDDPHTSEARKKEEARAQLPMQDFAAYFKNSRSTVFPAIS